MTELHPSLEQFKVLRIWRSRRFLCCLKAAQWIRIIAPSTEIRQFFMLLDVADLI